MDLNTNEINKPKSNILKNGFWLTVWTVLIFFILLRVFVYQHVNVSGASMQPNYQTSNLLLINQIHRDQRSRGQVVAIYENLEIAKNANYFTRFQAGTEFFLKRVIGLPGESIEVIKDKVIIYNSSYPNGIMLEENYVADSVKAQERATNYYFPKTKIPDGEYFLMGDNRTNSLDSRVKGTFPEYAILGQEDLRFWPLGEFETFKLPNYKFSPITADIQKVIDSQKK